MDPHAVGHVDGLVGVVDGDVHVHAEDELLARHEAQGGDQLAVARARDDPLVLPHRERVGARRADGQAAPGGGAAHLSAQPAQLLARLRGVGPGFVEISSTDSISSGLISPSLGVFQQGLDRVHEVVASRRRRS